MKGNEGGMLWDGSILLVRAWTEKEKYGEGVVSVVGNEGGRGNAAKSWSEGDKV